MWTLVYAPEHVTRTAAQATVDAVAALVAAVPTMPEDWTIAEFVRTCNDELLFGHLRAATT